MKLPNYKAKAKRVKIKPPSETVGPPHAGFNFIENFFDSRRDARRLNVLVALIVLALLAGTLTAGMRSASDIGVLNKQLQEANERLQRADAIQAKILGVSGSESVPDHLQSRQAEFKVALTGDASLIAASDALLGSSSSVPGLTISKVIVKGTSDNCSTTPTTGGSTNRTIFNQTTTTTKSGKTTAPTVEAKTPFSVQATATSYDQITLWTQALRAVPYVTLSSTPCFSGAPPSISVTAAGNLDTAKIGSSHSAIAHAAEPVTTTTTPAKSGGK